MSSAAVVVDHRPEIITLFSNNAFKIKQLILTSERDYCLYTNIYIFHVDDTLILHKNDFKKYRKKKKIIIIRERLAQ